MRNVNLPAPHLLPERLKAHCQMLLFAVGAFLLPVAAFAHDDDEAPVPLDPQVEKMQNRTIGFIVAVVVLAAGWYYLRRWQIVRAARNESLPKPPNDMPQQ